MLATSWKWGQHLYAVIQGVMGISPNKYPCDNILKQDHSWWSLKHYDRLQELLCQKAFLRRGEGPYSTTLMTHTWAIARDHEPQAGGYMVWSNLKCWSCYDGSLTLMAMTNVPTLVWGAGYGMTPTVVQISRCGVNGLNSPSIITVHTLLLPLIRWVGEVIIARSLISKSKNPDLWV